MAILEVSMNYLGSRRRPADPGWVNERSAGNGGRTLSPLGETSSPECRKAREWHQKGRAHNLMLLSEAAFRRRREQGSETPSLFAIKLPARFELSWIQVLMICSCLVFLSACENSISDTQAETPPTKTPEPEIEKLWSLPALNISDATLEVMVSGLTYPWAFEFLSQNELIITELSGNLLRYDLESKTLRQISGLPEIAVDTEQSGLLDVEIHPDFVNNKRIYFSYVAKDQDTGRFFLTAVASGILDDDQLLNSEQILAAGPFGWSPSNFGGALEFDADGFLYVAIGDRSEHMFAQHGDRLQGKILRLNDDGSTPGDNPFVDDPNVDDRIYALGVRNPQGLHFDSQSGMLYESEHGPKGGDEVNIITAGANYGWPEITYGQKYPDVGIGEIGQAGTHLAGMEQPLFYYLPSEAVSPIITYRGEMFSDWDGHLLIGTLKGKHISKLDVDGTTVRSEYPILKEINGRIRDIKIAHDGSIYILSQTGTLYRLFRTPPDTPVVETDKGEMIYGWACSGCHDTGADDAPRLNVRSEWKQIENQPLELTYSHVIEGYLDMPARGLCSICTDDHLRSTVDYMLEQVQSSESE